MTPIIQYISAGTLLFDKVQDQQLKNVQHVTPLSMISYTVDITHGHYSSVSLKVKEITFYAKSTKVFVVLILEPETSSERSCALDIFGLLWKLMPLH